MKLGMQRCAQCEGFSEPGGALCGMCRRNPPKEKETFYGIMGREKGKGKFKPFDYQAGSLVTNVIYQTMWFDRGQVQDLVDKLNKDNQDYEFKVIKRS